MEISILFAVVIIILAGFTLHGWIKGFVRVVFSLVSIFLTIALVTWMTPYTARILEKTSIYDNIQEKCVQSIQGEAQTEMQQETETQEPLRIAGIEIPGEWQEILSQKTVETADGILEQSGIYEEIGNYIAGILINIIASITSFIIVFLVLRILINLLDLVARLPVLHSMNRLGGIIAGAVEGVLVVWILFFIITLCQSSELCQGFLQDINENAFLKTLYENNLIEYIMMRVIMQ